MEAYPQRTDWLLRYLCSTKPNTQIYADILKDTECAVLILGYIITNTAEQVSGLWILKLTDRAMYQKFIRFSVRWCYPRSDEVDQLHTISLPG